MKPPLTLVSHVLCPYVQRAVIALNEKGIDYQRIDIDLARKPDWFLKLSPLGKTPLLLVGDEPIFESAVICEYLEDTAGMALHPGDALLKARHRSWIEFASATLNAIGGLYSAPDPAAFNARLADLKGKMNHLESELASRPAAGPYFASSSFSLVDAAFAPAFRYFDVFDRIDDWGVFADAPRVSDWRHALRGRPSVLRAVSADYPELLWQFLLGRNSEISRRIERLTAAVR